MLGMRAGRAPCFAPDARTGPAFGGSERLLTGDPATAVPFAGVPPLMTDPAGFLASVEPLLRCGDLRALLAHLRENWPAERLLELLGERNAAVVSAAARCLGYVGLPAHQAALVRLLSDNRMRVVRAAEEALWHLWMRAGPPRAGRELAEAVRLVGEDRLDEARELLESLTLREPLLAEAHHQLGLVASLMDDLPAARAAHEMAVGLNPLHYAAWVELGHIAVLEGRLDEALHFYERALKIHPRFEPIREVVPRLRALVSERSVA